MTVHLVAFQYFVRFKIVKFLRILRKYRESLFCEKIVIQPSWLD